MKLPKNIWKKLRDKGYGASFLVATKDGEKISIQDAIK